MLDAELVKLCLGLALLLTVAVWWIGRSQVTSGAPFKGADDRFRNFQRTYLVVYLTAMMADWLQGPYVYALYASYGFTKSDNAVLFTAGFGSSAICGTLVGSLADRMGRRKFAALYCVLYGVSCMTKHMNDFTFLLLGRLTGGIATSLLFSVFDAWMVAEHNRRDFDSALLGETFTLAVTGNSIVAIIAGEIGQVAADMKELTRVSPSSALHFGGYCSPFDIAIGFLLVSLTFMSSTWSENFGQKSSGGVGSVSYADSVRLALRTIIQQPTVLQCGVVCSFFESSMFIFVFMWTPALTEEGAAKPPYGHIFASFMVMCMLGSQIFSIASKHNSIETIGRYTLLLAAACQLVPVFTADAACRFLSFLVFEMCVGLYFPMMGTMKGTVVPEESRSTIYNLYRLPLNIIVVLTLVSHVEIQTAFTLTFFLLIIAAFFMTKLIASRHALSAYRRLDTEFGLDDLDLDDADGGIGPDDELKTMMGSRS